MNDFDRPPRWYQDAVIYELHVRAFQDGNSDGIGDFKGLIRRLDYLQDLGVTALWLLPFYPSPLRDDGYDIADYGRVHPAYGDLDDFRRFLDAAHRRGLFVITELVINHTSDQHPWFQRARRAPAGSPDRAFYVWSATPTPYRDARIIFQDFELSNWSWDPVANAYYWHRFYSHQPDLNFDNPAVHDALFAAMDFWLEMGVDGMRLDAIPYLYEREGTNCENLPETHAFLKKLRAHVDARFPNRLLLAEANQWPEDAAEYFGDGDECHMNFHFPLMPRMYMSVAQEDRFSLVDILDQTPPLPDGCQWATFLRNHDELTLEMVTDEERVAMLRAYASQPRARVNLGIRRRLAPLMQNHRPRIELMLGLLLSLPGTPVLYYGDEIGMGDNIFLGDRDGVRTPMQWSGDRNAGFSGANPQQLFLPLVIDPEYHFTGVNVEIQQANPTSLLWHTRRMLGLRSRHPALGRGSLCFLEPDNRKVLAFLRETDDERILVVANLARTPQSVELGLGRFIGHRPVELSGPTTFPPIGELPYHLSLGPYGLYWFRLDPADREPSWVLEHAATPPRVEAALDDAGAFAWSALSGRPSTAWGRALRGFLDRQRWFTSEVAGVTVADLIPVDDDVHVAILAVATADEGDQTWAVPLAFAVGEAAAEVRARHLPVLAHVALRDGGEGVVYDPTSRPAFVQALLELIAGGATRVGSDGRLIAEQEGLGVAAPEGEPWVRVTQADVPVTRLVASAMEDAGRGARRAPPREGSAEGAGADGGAAWVIAGDGALDIAIYRRLGTGGGPAAELGRAASAAGVALVPPQLGGLGWLGPDAPVPEPIVVVRAHAGGGASAREWARDEALMFLEGELAVEGFAARGEGRREAALEEQASRARGTVLACRALGRELAELHAALAAAWEPAAFSRLYQRALYQDLRTTARRALEAVERRGACVDEGTRARARELIEREASVLDALDDVLGDKLDAARVRVHGDLTLERLRWTGHAFALVELAGPLDQLAAEQRIQRSPLVDVASLTAGLELVAHETQVSLTGRGLGREAEVAEAGRYWVRAVREGLLGAYRAALAERAGGGPRLVPADDGVFAMLLGVFELKWLLSELDRAVAAVTPATDRVGALLDTIDARLP